MFAYAHAAGTDLISDFIGTETGARSERHRQLLNTGAVKSCAPVFDGAAARSFPAKLDASIGVPLASSGPILPISGQQMARYG